MKLRKLHVTNASSGLTRKYKHLSREFRGGLVNCQKTRQDMGDKIDKIKDGNHLECRFVTMFDFYALSHDFPGYAEVRAQRDAYQKVKILEGHLKDDIGDTRFIPYIQLHMVGEQNSELINDGPDTAPSKRILKEIPEYGKVTSGSIVTEKIGFPMLRQKCCHFDEWISTLEQLNRATP